jgi:hypothetical protein
MDLNAWDDILWYLINTTYLKAWARTKLMHEDKTKILQYKYKDIKIHMKIKSPPSIQAYTHFFYVLLSTKLFSIL